MISILKEMFTYLFVIRAMEVGLLVSLCAALLGVSLVLKRYSMIGDGLSHVGFGTLAIATAMKSSRFILGLPIIGAALTASPLTISIPIVVIAAFLLLRISESSKIKGDAAIALISSSSLAIGVMVISLTTGMNTDVCNYMFGSILAMRQSDVTLSIILTVVVMILFVLFYHKIFAVTFDESFAKATGVRTGLYNMLIAFLTAITVVLGMRMMGALLISSLVIFPALTAMRICKKFKTVTICAALVSIICFFIGLVISYTTKMPAGASVVLVNIIAFLLFCAIGKVFSIKGGTGIMRIIRKSVATLFCLASVLVIFTGCKAREAEGTAITADQQVGPPAAPASTAPQLSVQTGKVVEIKDNLFIAQLDDIYLNREDYLGKTIKYEGIFTSYTWEEENMTYYLVYRKSPGCCGADGQAGFEVIWPEGEEKPYPQEDDWCEVVGTLEEYDEDGYMYIRLALTSLTVLPVRGVEFVSQ